MFIFYALLPYVCLPCLHWVKWLFQTGLFSFWRPRKWLVVALDRWLSYAVMIVWEFAWADSALVVLDKWLSYRGRRLNRFDCKMKVSFTESKVLYFKESITFQSRYCKLKKVLNKKLYLSKDMFINMRQFLVILWTFELLLNFDQLFSSNLQSGNELCTNHKQNYSLSENVLFSKNDKTAMEIYLKNLETNKKKKIKK